MISLGYEMGSCVVAFRGQRGRACIYTLKKNGEYYRRIVSMHLSRPEDYFSIYQSGCNHSCLKCHSWEFSQFVSGRWRSISEITENVYEYSKDITVWEPRERATMWHASTLCNHCGRCVIEGKKGKLCPGILSPDKIRISPQGFGPSRNIAAFTGGDILCRADFYAEASEKIKDKCDRMWVLIETNGYGAVKENLKILREKIDSFWLDIKAYSEDVYRRLCGTSNRYVLRAPAIMHSMDFIVEVLTLYIPGLVEIEEIKNIASMIYSIDDDIPMTLLAFFPNYKMSNFREPSVEEMIEAFRVIKGVGLKNVRLGNIGVFIKNEEDLEKLIDETGKEGIG